MSVAIAVAAVVLGMPQPLLRALAGALVSVGAYVLLAALLGG